MLTQMHDFTIGDDDKYRKKLQVPTSVNVVICNWKPLLATIQCCIICITTKLQVKFQI
jgi:hypothetical protein